MPNIWSGGEKKNQLSGEELIETDPEEVARLKSSFGSGLPDGRNDIGFPLTQRVKMAAQRAVRTLITPVR